MEMIKATILERGIEDTLWPEVVLMMTHVKNLRPTQALKNSISSIKKQNNILPSLQHLYVLGSTVYTFLHKEKCTLKLAKLNARALRRKLVGFDSHIIYKVHIEEQNKMIRVENV